MTTASRWLSLIWLLASLGFAQEETDVKVVFVPELKPAEASATPSVVPAAGGISGIRLPQDLAVGMAVTTLGSGSDQLVAPLPAAPTRDAAAPFTIVVVDPPGVGFNDTTPAVAAPGNNGVTVGEQRLNAVRHAAAIWSSKL